MAHPPSRTKARAFESIGHPRGWELEGLGGVVKGYRSEKVYRAAPRSTGMGDTRRKVAL